MKRFIKTLNPFKPRQYNWYWGIVRMAIAFIVFRLLGDAFSGYFYLGCVVSIVWYGNRIVDGWNEAYKNKRMLD